MHRSHLVLSLCTLAAASGWLNAQDTRLAGPVSGIVYHAPSRAVRPILGIPGAAYLGGDLLAGLDFAALSPDGRSAIAVKDGALYAVTGISTGEAVWTRLESSVGEANRAAWSPGSKAVAVYSSTSRRLEFWSFGDSVEARAASDLSELAGTLTALCIEDSAARAFVALESETEGGVYVVPAGTPARLLARAARPSAIAIASGGSLFFADRATSEIFELSDSGDVRLFANEARGVIDPIAIALSPDRLALITASRTGRNITIFDIASRALKGRLDLDFEPSRVEPFSRSLYLLNEARASEPLRVLDAEREPAVYFIPAGPAASEE
jgi:hypothetical protein